MSQLIKKLIINTQLEVLTGLHVGGSSDNVEIGGIDNPVIKLQSRKGTPYIPGSSLKGKIRCLLEQIAGSPKVGGEKEINILFGYSEDNIPSKLIVRDSYLDLSQNSDYKQAIEEQLLDMPFTESKWENVIDRVKGTAEHPRQMERVPAGARFNVQFVINVWTEDGDGEQLMELLKKGITALESDYLGGSGSRGYGQVKFDKIEISKTIDFTNYFASNQA